MHDLFPHHPPQVPVDPRQAQVACQAGNGADHQRQQRKKQVGQHDGEKAHLAGEQRGAVFGRADTHVGNEGRYRQIPHDPEIGQPRLAQHGKKAPETAVPLAEQCVLFHLLLPSLSGHTPESKRDPLVLRARRARWPGAPQPRTKLAGSPLTLLSCLRPVKRSGDRGRRRRVWLCEGCRFHPAHILSQTTGLVIGCILPHFYTGKQQRCRFCPIAGLFCRFRPQRGSKQPPELSHTCTGRLHP